MEKVLSTGVIQNNTKSSNISIDRQIMQSAHFNTSTNTWSVRYKDMQVINKDLTAAVLKLFELINTMGV